MADCEHHKYFFIITYGRSGSTLLQGILNAAEDIHCTGENGDFLHSLYLAHKTLVETQKQVGNNAARKSTEPFFGIDHMRPDEFSDGIRHLVGKMILSSCPSEKRINHIGFKEIRYPYKKDLADYLEFINQAFLNPAFIFLWRDLDNVLSSGMFAELSKFEREQKHQLFFHFEETATSFARGKSNCATIHYEWFKSKPQEILRALRAIGLPVNEENITDTIKVPHSYTWKGKNV